MRTGSGQVPFGSGDIPVRSASGRRYVLRIGFGAMLWYEQQAGRTFFATAAALEQGRAPSVKDLVQLTCAAAQHHHPGFGISDAVDVLDAAPDIVSRLLRIAAPEPLPDAPGEEQKKNRSGLMSIFSTFWPGGLRRG